MLSFASSDVLVIVAGWFTNSFSIQAMTIVLQITSIVFDLGFGFGMAAAAQIGKYVG